MDIFVPKENIEHMVIKYREEGDAEVIYEGSEKTCFALLGLLQMLENKQWREGFEYQVAPTWKEA